MAAGSGHLPLLSQMLISADRHDRTFCGRCGMASVRRRRVMNVTRRFVSVAATLALAASVSLPGSRSFAQSNEEGAVLQAVDALTKAMLDADRAKLEELVADQLSYGHSSGVIQTKAQFVDAIINK